MPCLERDFTLLICALDFNSGQQVAKSLQKDLLEAIYAEASIPLEGGLSQEALSEIAALQHRQCKVQIGQLLHIKDHLTYKLESWKPYLSFLSHVHEYSFIDAEQGVICIAGIKDSVTQLQVDAKLLLEKFKMNAKAKQKMTWAKLLEVKASSGPSAFLQLLSENDALIPADWVHHADKSVSEIFEVCPGDAFHVELVEGQLLGAASHLITSTWNESTPGCCEVERVERIENVALWKKYASKRAEFCRSAAQAPVITLGDLGMKTLSTKGTMLDQTLISEINECYLLRGVDLGFLEGIKRQGLDSSSPSSKKGLFGRGLYFNETSSEAHQSTGE